MKRIFTAIFIFITIATQAQNTLRGKITDAGTGKPLSGASVTFGKNSGTTTDKDGVFTVDCSKASKITVSYVGYETFDQVIHNCNEELHISLQPAGHSLDQVEITATSNVNKSILYQPISIAKITTPELRRGTGLFLDDAIQTNAPGVTM
ncbi:MAG TPA: carboxypeptidase-like regulatory domain-containing protein, partial [Chitinophagaceae bacterium]|nr:carboxypeptidase-like regulatory domain-containing protein [Chitinophagaceae bacterium]